MGNIPAELGRTLGTGAPEEGSVFVLLYRCAAGGAPIGQLIGHGALRPLGKVNLQNLRDDLSGLANFDRIPYPDVPGGNEILVVERGVGDGGARQAYRRHHGFRRQHAGSSHLNHNVPHHRRLDFRRILIGRRPPRELGGGAQSLPIG